MHLKVGWVHRMALGAALQIHFNKIETINKNKTINKNETINKNDTINKIETILKNVFDI